MVVEGQWQCGTSGMWWWWWLVWVVFGGWRHSRSLVQHTREEEAVVDRWW
jgi:hypothetical protein